MTDLDCVFFDESSRVRRRFEAEFFSTPFFAVVAVEFKAMKDLDPPSFLLRYSSSSTATPLACVPKLNSPYLVYSEIF